MQQVIVKSDYSPDTFLKLVSTEDGDAIFKVCGKGEMRISTSGGQFHGKKLIAVLAAFRSLMDALSMEEDSLEMESMKPDDLFLIDESPSVMQFLKNLSE